MQQGTLAEHRRRPRARIGRVPLKNVEGFGLPAVAVLGRTAADRNGRVRKGISVAGLGGADDQGLVVGRPIQ